jgi:hypothetical protein
MSSFLRVGRNLICATYGVLGPAAPWTIDSHLLGKSLTLTSPNVAAVNLKRHAIEVWILPLRRPMMHNHGKIAQEREVAG